MKKDKFMKKLRKRDIELYSEVYGVKKSVVKETIEVLKDGISENQILDNWTPYLKNRIKRPEKFTGMLFGWGEFVVHNVTGICYHESSPFYKETRKLNHELYVGRSEIKRRNVRRSPDSLYGYNNEEISWKNFSELKEINDFSRVCGRILVTGVWYEDEPKPNYHTSMVDYLTGWAIPEIEINYVDTHKPWPYKNQIEKWMHIPEYRTWEKD
jgi:hypothetical protein